MLIKCNWKRSDCPLVTLALVLDASGFPKRSEMFPGNASEPETLGKMINKLTSTPSEQPPTVKQIHDNAVKVQRIVCSDQNEVELYCHSEQREKKESGIHTQYTERFE